MQIAAEYHLMHTLRLKIQLKFNVAPSLIQAHLAVRSFRYNFFVFNVVAAKLCKEQQISIGNSTKYSDFIDGKYIFDKLTLKRTLLFKENRV